MLGDGAERRRAISSPEARSADRRARRNGREGTTRRAPLSARPRPWRRRPSHPSVSHVVRWAGRLAERLAETASIRDRVAVLEAALRRRLAGFEQLDPIAP